ncbi:MAG: hypothetical protein H7Z16_02930 [Pyrinomonadaceae bacterium]|nr:hypothetical protein [Pyrinomonadaceae bacterium]
MKPLSAALNEEKLMPSETQISENNSPGALTEKVKELLSEFLTGYEKEPILRALVQLLFPFGGPSDFLLAWKATNLYQQRVQALLESVVISVSNLEERTLNKDFLYSEEFLELLGTCIEIVARTASERKRKYIAAFLVGTIKSGQAHDLSQQIAEDLRVLQDFHLQMLTSVPDSLLPNVLAPVDERASHRVIDLHKLRAIVEMDWAVFSKGRTDLERLGFIRYDSEATAWAGGDIGNYWITGYFTIFKDSLAEA